MTADERHAEEILFAHTFVLWVSCTDPVRRQRYYAVLEMHRKRLRRLGFSEGEIYAIERFHESPEEV
jgi:hypothetical protein